MARDCSHTESKNQLSLYFGFSVIFAGVAGLRERKKRATRIAIRDAAMALFEQHGFAQTTFDRIAEAADVSRATVFSYFPTKEDIVFGDAGARGRRARRHARRAARRTGHHRHGPRSGSAS